MLNDLTITNLGVISSARLELSRGLTVLTGETGAGKTMVVSSLRLLSGCRADASKVRIGADKAIVEGSFGVAGMDDHRIEAIAAIAEAAGCEADENGEYIVARSVSSNGRSRAHLTGRSVPAATLAKLTEHLLTIHGQNDQLALTNPARQVAIVDESSPEATAARAAYERAYKHYRKLDERRRDLAATTRERAQEVDRLQFAINEIDKVDPAPGEEDEIKATVARLQDAQAMREAMVAAVAFIDGDGYEGGEQSGALELVGLAADKLSCTDTADTVLRGLAERLTATSSELADISSALAEQLDSLDTEGANLDELLSRAQAIKKLIRKYAPDTAGVIAWRAKAAKKLDSINVSSDELEALKAEVAEAKKRVLELGADLTKARQRAAATLAATVTKELAGLAMPTCRCEIACTPTDPGPDGMDRIEFLLGAAPGQPAVPIGSAASGGELSRIMLAVEVVTALKSRSTTYVFDEVDAGVGGRAAVEIGKRLARLARSHQVIVVTHLPQVAAFADKHLHVSKQADSAGVESSVHELTGDERVTELARMLAGLDDTASGQAHAAELMAMAQRFTHGLSKEG